MQNQQQSLSSAIKSLVSVKCCPWTLPGTTSGMGVRESRSHLFKISAYNLILPTCGTFPLQSASAGDYGFYMPMAYIGCKEDNYIYFLVESGSS